MRCAYIVRYKRDIQRFFSWSAIDYPTCHLYLLRVHTCLKVHVYDKKIKACMYTEKIPMTRGVFLWYITQKRFISNGFLSYSYCIFWVIGNIWWLYLSCKRTLSEKGPFVPSVAWQRKHMNWPTGVQRLGNRVSHCYINLFDKLIGLSALGPFEWRYFIKLYILSVFKFVS